MPYELNYILLVALLALFPAGPMGLVFSMFLDFPKWGRLFHAALLIGALWGIFSESPFISAYSVAFLIGMAVFYYTTRIANKEST